MKPLAHIFPNFYPFHCWRNPNIHEIGDSVYEFLNHCSGPTHIYIPGEDSSRCRVVVTLLHGNEPSGFHAIYQLLKENVKPKVDIHCFIPSIAAAKTSPVFHYRMLPGQKDLNRCFKAPFTDNAQDTLARGILDTIHYLRPEAVIDIHNTSGSGPSFGVTTFMHQQHDALVSLFTHRLIVTNLSLGSLMEISNEQLPAVTVECGGAQDTESNHVARNGLVKFFTLDNIPQTAPNDFALQLFHNPIRLELTEKATVVYDNLPPPDVELALSPDIEHHNFDFVDENTELGFLNGCLADVIQAKNHLGEEVAQQFFHAANGILRPTQQLKLFMVTTNPEIAKKDCLFYFVSA